jgi:hypothetical protein
MLPTSGFLATLLFMFHIKNRGQLIRATHPFRLDMGKRCLNPNDGDVMINDAGKQRVKTDADWLPAEPSA